MLKSSLNFEVGKTRTFYQEKSTPETIGTTGNLF